MLSISLVTSSPATGASDRTLTDTSSPTPLLHPYFSPPPLVSTYRQTEQTKPPPFLVAAGSNKNNTAITAATTRHRNGERVRRMREIERRERKDSGEGAAPPLTAATIAAWRWFVSRSDDFSGASRLGRTLDLSGLVWFESRVRLRIISNSGQIWSCLGSGQQRVRVMVWFNSGFNSGQNWSRGILCNRLMGFGSSQFSMDRVFGLSQLG
ncbi:hypothetical protein HanPSC8_Chr09g0353881 [Helianthus annuus]|nr:hypothetical protein HanPSC8_Chr09g0353881 [Helianthus annuus]